ncbi:MAG TPA: formylmethanofuran dehydrogenase subunit B, partial [Methanoregulaceae archaeon]|nr:formylmethanofuran dehydrogenase subunit B [Methanoregulaceae archaeon]
KLHVPVAFVGVEVGGCCYWMDNVPIESRKVVDPPEGMMTDTEFLTRVRDRVAELKAQAPVGAPSAAEPQEA